MNKKSNYINGQWQAGNAEPMTVYDSATGDLLWQGNAVDPHQIHQAVEAATHAFKGWSQQSLAKRFELLQAYREQLTKIKQELALTISQEMGKPLPESQAEVVAMINKIAISMDAYQERCKEKTQALAKSSIITGNRPLGVMVIVGPFNFPGHLPNGHLVPALLAGNTVIFKPSELTPMTALKMLECIDAAGFPAGVVNCINGGKHVSQVLLNEPIQGVLFTGSYATGQAIHQQLAGRPEILLALEMGGNNPLVLADASDHDKAIDCIIQSAFITAGQRCICARRLIIIRNKDNEALLNALINKTRGLSMGDYRKDPPAFIAPVVSQAAAENILKQQEILLQQGAKPLLQLTQDKNNPKLLSPGILDISACAGVADKEIFGPLLQIIWVDDLQTAIATANNTAYGLAAGCITDDPEKFQLFYQQAKAGIINWNCPLSGASSAAPFGGIGHSGNYRPSAYYAADYCAYPVASMRQCDEKHTKGE